MHDDYVIGYSVDFRKKILVIKTQDNHTITFHEVLTHSLRCILEYNQILDICEASIKSFIIENKDELMQMKDYCWPIYYQTTKELIDFMNNNEYKYVKIYSSYGMFGWVLAKSYMILCEKVI